MEKGRVRPQCPAAAGMQAWIGMGVPSLWPPQPSGIRQRPRLGRRIRTGWSQPALSSLGRPRGPPCTCPTPASLLTFKEDKPPIVPLVGSVDVPREAPPEVPDGHGVVVQHPVVPDPPEPPALVGNKALAEEGGDTHRYSPGARCLAQGIFPPRDPPHLQGRGGRGS